MRSLKLWWSGWRDSRVKLWLVALGVLLLGIDAARIVDEHDTALAHARRNTATLAASLALHAESTVRTAEGLLSGLVTHLEVVGWGSGKLPTSAAAVVSGEAALDWINLIAFFDVTGQMLLGPAGPPPNVADRAFFVDHRDRPGRDVRIGVPQRSRFTGKLVLPITRRVNHPDGSFAGVALVTLDIERLLAGYKTIGLTQNAVLGAFAADGTLLLRHPMAEANLGHQFIDTPMYAAVRSGAMSGEVEQLSPADGVTRLLSYHRFLDGRLVMSVGSDRATALEDWWRGTEWHLGGLAALVTVIVVLGGILERRERGRRLAEIAAARQRTKLRVLARHASDIVLEFDAEFCCRHVRGPLWESCGHMPERMLGTRMLEVLRPAEEADISGLFASAMRGDTEARGTVLLHCGNGTPIWMEVALWRYEETGEAPAVLGVMHDVSSRHSAEARAVAALVSLRVTHATLLRAEAMAHLGHWRLDTGSGGITWSEEVRRIHAWPEGDAQPGALDATLERVHPEDREMVTEAMRRAMRQGSGFQLDYRIVRPDGTIRHVSCFGEPERDGAGRVTEIIGTSQDVTERVLIERELLHEQKMQTLGQLAAGVAHDFNNLLQGITGCLELIGDDAGQTARSRKFVGLALASAERGSALTRHLLSCARKQVLKPKPLLAAAILRETRDLLERTLGPRISVVAEITGGLLAIAADPAHLQTALLNLGINAGHAMPDGGTLTLRAAMRASEGDTPPVIVISVADTGRGMDPATLAKAAEPFFTTKGTEGTGLGLSMVSGFAAQSGGAMRLFSELGRGTRVELHLPTIHTPAIAGPDGPPGVRIAASSHQFRALVVDDTVDVLVTTVAFLETVSERVASAASGEEALLMLARDPAIDVLITDFAMPGLDGVETIRRARALRPELAAVIISGYADAADLADPPAGTRILQKPFQRRELLDAVEGAMARSHAESHVCVALV